jgi:hypothetical protein
MRPTRHAATSLRILFLSLIFACASCASVEFSRTTESSGTFEAKGTSFTIFGVDIPRSALNQARENASDAGLHNMEVTETTIFPYLGWMDFIFEIISVRRATIRGTWGYADQP